MGDVDGSPGERPGPLEEDTADAPIPFTEGLFELPSGARRPAARIVLITGPSGVGKTRLTRRLGLPAVSLDDFYLDGDHPDLPRRFGIVDWDDPRSWDAAGAMSALLDLARTGRAEVPVYDIPTNRRTTTRLMETGGSPIVLAEGIFAAELVSPARDEGILADALCIWRPRAQTFFFRLMRDLGEARKPPATLIRRGLHHFRNEPKKIADLTAKGTRKVRIEEAEARIRQLVLER